MVSIIIPNFNRALYLEQALCSVMSQTYQDWEALVVDDGSTDESKKLAESLVISDTRIKWMERHLDTKGAATCRNIGIDNAKGDYIIFLDSDDLLAPECLQERVAIMEADKQLDFAVFKMQYFNEHPGDDTRLWNIETNEPALDRFLKLDAVWQTSGPIWKRTALESIDGFNQNLHCWQDIDIHLKALFANLNFKIYYDLDVDCYYRKNSTDSISQTNTSSLKKLKSKAELFHWAKPQADLLGKDSLQIALHILISAQNGHHFNFYRDFYNQVKNELTKSIMRDLFTLSIIQNLRLYKLSFFKSKFNDLKTKMISETSIGKYHV